MAGRRGRSFFFFEHLVEKKLVAKAKPEHGRFRSFLLGSFKNYRSVYIGRDKAIKRGGKETILWIDDPSIEARYSGELERENSYLHEVREAKAFGELMG